MAMPKGLAAYWAKHGRGKKHRRHARIKVVRMARRRSYTGRRRGHRGGKKGIIGGYGVIDIAQGLYTAEALGAFNAVNDLMAGNMDAAKDDLISGVSSPASWVNVVVGNIIIGFGGKLIRRFAPKKLKAIL